MSTAVVPPAERDEHLAAVAATLARVDDAALAGEIAARTRPLFQAREAFGTRAINARNATAKVQWLRAEADIVAHAVAPMSPCRPGCSHCCHQGVAIARAEAEVIGREIGRRVATPASDRVLTAAMLTDAESDGERADITRRQRAWMVDAYQGVPCTFLKNDRCSIYEHRPTVCRLHISVAPNALPCRLVPGASIRGPYVDATSEQRLYVATFAGDQLQLADIRDWFPKGAG